MTALKLKSREYVSGQFTMQSYLFTPINLAGDFDRERIIEYPGATHNITSTYLYVLDSRRFVRTNHFEEFLLYFAELAPQFWAVANQYRTICSQMQVPFIVTIKSSTPSVD